MYNLIIVEDEQNICDGLAYLFPWNDLHFHIAGSFNSGQEALDYVQKNPVDAVLTDIMMPCMTGLALAHEILREKPDMQIVFLTGHRDFEFAHEALKMHACNYLLKPVMREELISTFLEIKERLDEKYGEALDAAQESYYKKIITQAQNYIHQNLKTVTLESTALVVNLSYSYLSRLFKEITGIGFAEHCTQARMNQAAKMLLETDMRTYEISDAVGYDNPKNFTRAFKKCYGISPREYRNGIPAQVITTEEGLE